MPKRRLIVPKGHVYHYGVDPGTTRVAIACIGPDGHRIVTVPIPKCDGGKRLGLIYTLTRDAAFEMALRCPAGLCWVEQPSGKRENPSLSYATGVILAAMWQGLGNPSVTVETVPSATWKLGATGFGAHSKWKPDPTNPKKKVPKTLEEYGVGQWARGIGYVGSSIDEVDALGVAVAARNAVELVER